MKRDCQKVSQRSTPDASKLEHGAVAELADALDLGSSTARCAGSIPVSPTDLLTLTEANLFVKSLRRIEMLNIELHKAMIAATAQIIADQAFLKQVKGEAKASKEK